MHINVTRECLVLSQAQVELSQAWPMSFTKNNSIQPKNQKTKNKTQTNNNKKKPPPKHIYRYIYNSDRYILIIVTNSATCSYTILICISTYALAPIASHVYVLSLLLTWKFIDKGTLLLFNIHITGHQYDRLPLTICQYYINVVSTEHQLNM